MTSCGDPAHLFSLEAACARTFAEPDFGKQDSHSRAGISALQMNWW